LAQHRFKDERHQAGEGEGLRLLIGTRRTKQFLLQRKRGKKIEIEHYNKMREYIISMQAGTRTESYDIFFPQENVHSSHHVYTAATTA